VLTHFAQQLEAGALVSVAEGESMSGTYRLRPAKGVVHNGMKEAPDEQGQYIDAPEGSPSLLQSGLAMKKAALEFSLKRCRELMAWIRRALLPDLPR